MPSYVSHLECSYTGKQFEIGGVRTVSEFGKPLLVRYDLDRLGMGVSREDIGSSSEPGFWRYSPLLPVERKRDRISLGEVITPLVPLERSAPSLGAEPGKIHVKDESRLPTGSFKARGLALAVSMAKQLGISHLAVPTNGNAGSALAAYASRAGIRTTVLCPDNTPEINLRETMAQGADTNLVNGLIGECGRVISDGSEEVGWFAVSTLREPYRIEGKKTMGIELAEQMGWDLPDVIFYPTGGGTGIIGMWKAFAELSELGWIDCELPKMVAVQSTGCAPIVRAWESGEEFAEYWGDAETVASGIRVPAALGDFLILRAVKESGGFAIAVTDEDSLEARRQIGARDGLLLCPEAAATAAACKIALEEGLISTSDRVVLFNTATGLKYPLPEVTKRINKDEVDFGSFRLR
ncbi:MAG: threonine synthase [Candidatus Thalassarchaeaceae archaeon]|nr:threonine synthase [Candidatus Thalassarchaeaceae archaeon]MDP7256916.1 threonine synthase [Candidatus Thalassarchaeaceae archaeon]MDP7446495.1 threonine synthase [Candidatus Thalassarchaeaceae archaeon]MDP7649070.1 threonine synthase [Candidatus Thalassarchaeaceae archaeon]HJM77508.1 threonine synthase [Candidatus Thalassarchaeaceae archaeon]